MKVWAIESTVATSPWPTVWIMNTAIQKEFAQACRLAQNTNMLVFDAAYSDEEYPSFRGWGHSTWQEGYKTAQALDVKALALAGLINVVDTDLDAIKAQVDGARCVRPSPPKAKPTHCKSAAPSYCLSSETAKKC